MRKKTAIATSIFAFLLCTVVTLRAQDSPASAPPAENPDASGTAPTPSTLPTRVRIGGNVAAAMLTHQVQPKYPKSAKENHVSGTIVLDAVISMGGTVQKLQYISGPAELMRSAMDAVRQWRYKPMKLQGKPVEFETKISVVYTLMD